MPETVQGYPKWDGELSNSPRFITIVAQEVRRAMQNQWARAALLFAVGYGIISIGSLFSARSNPTVHSVANFVTFISLLRWAALAVASIMAGPALLEDSQKGALELYRSRGVSRWSYLAGKVLAVSGLAFVAIAAPGLVYWAGTYVMFDTHPDGWGFVAFGVLGDALIWSLVITGLGLGLSAVARSTRASTIVLFGAVFGLNVLFSNILGGITKRGDFAVISPIAAMGQQVEWLYPGAKAPLEFPSWWGLVALATLLLIGWGLVWWRQPRIKGVE